MITVTGTATLDDYLDAQRHHARARNLVVPGILAAAAAIVAALSREYAFAVAVCGYLAIRPLYLRGRLKRHWERTPSAHRGERTQGLDGKGFHSTDDDGNPTVVHWANFIKWRESKRTFFLYLGPHYFVYLPKRLVAPEDQERLRSLLRETIGRRA